MSGTPTAADSDKRDPDLPSRRKPPFQFSLGWLLIGVTVVAVLLGISQMLGPRIIKYIGETLYAVGVGCVLPTPFVVAALFARGDVRVFSIGALVPWIVNRGTLPVYLAYQPGGPGLVAIVGSTIIVVVAAGICGVVAVAARRWLQRRGHDHA